MARTKKVTALTPMGTLIYPYLTKADNYQGKEKYKADIRVPMAEAEHLLTLIRTAMEKQEKKDTFLNDGDPMEYADRYYPFTHDEESGTTVFRASLNRFGNVGKPEQFEQSPDVYDAHGNLLDPSVGIYSGSQGRLNVELYGWTTDTKTIGVSLRLRAAQVVEIAERDKREADSYGFKNVEGGFDSNEVEAIGALEGDDAVDTSTAEQY